MASDAKQGVLLGWIVPLMALTVAAIAGGSLVGMQIVAAVKTDAASDNSAADTPSGGPRLSNAVVKELAPIVTNLASPDGAWVRLQTAIVYDRSDQMQMDVMSARIGDDILAFIKTLTLAQLQGASGLQHLREDLNERAATRSDGRVRELLIEMLVVQ